MPTPKKSGHVGWLAALIALMVAALTFSATTPAHADGDPDKDIVRELAIVYELDETGQMHVTETYRWDFGERNGLGFYRTLVRAMGYAPDRSKLRVYDYGNCEASSPSGAPASVWVEGRSQAEVRLAIGAPDGSSDTRTGVQTYVLSYDVLGAINAVRNEAGTPDQDELYYNVFTDTPNRVDRVTVTVRGPARVIDLACYQGRESSNDRCAQHSSDGSTATFTATDINKRQGLTIMAAFPPGTFSEPGPILVNRPPGAATEELVDTFWPLLAVAWAGLLALIVWVRKRLGRDWHYPDLEVGALPEPGRKNSRRRLLAEPGIVVRTFPPDGLRPAEGIVLADEKTSTKAFMATMIDLAVRAHLKIEPLGAQGKIVRDWQLTASPRPPESDQLYKYEQVLLATLFTGRTTVNISKLRGSFAKQLKRFNRALTAHTNRRRWFNRLGLVGGAAPIDYLIVGICAVSALVGVIGYLATDTIQTLGIVLMLGALSLFITWFLMAATAHARSALGRAHYEQVRGFREHLASVDGNQLRWQTGNDIFSDYLAWAVGFDLTKRWVGLFQDLHSAGRYEMLPGWYAAAGFTDFDSIGSSLERLESKGSADLSHVPSTSGSSGSSGSYSSGGGSSGGGGGGGSFGGR